MSVPIVISTLLVLGGVAFLLFLLYFMVGFEKRLRDQSFQTAEQIQHVFGQMSQELRHQSGLFQSAQSSIGDRLSSASNLVAEVQNRLGQMEQVNRQILDLGNTLGKEVGSLQSIFQAPKLRGGLGELFLGDLLEQVLGPEHYELQFPFKSGERVDAIVKLAQGRVPIDAKFPLENFRKYLAALSEPEKKNHRKEFYRDVRKHVDQIAEKYVVPDEGTMDFALMYIPAENIYYEIIIRDDSFGDATSISEYAQLKKVIPVSPNTLYVYLSSIARGLQGLKIESHAREILTNIQRMTGDLNKFDEEFHRVGTHLRNAVTTHEKASRQFVHFQEKFSLYDATGSVKLEEKVVSE